MRHKILICFFAGTWLHLSANAQGPEFEWAKQIVCNPAGDGLSITADNINNVYTIGSFTDSVDFDPGSGTFYMYSPNNSSGFIHKMDPNGNFIWAKKISATGFSVIVSPDNQNIFITGIFMGSADFDPGSGVMNLTSQGNTDIFILKLDSTGNFGWVKQVGGAEAEFPNLTIKDSLGNIYLTGRFSGQTDFDPGIGTNLLTSNGWSDAFTLKLDQNGELEWVSQIGAVDNDMANSVFVDNSLNVFTVGYVSLNGNSIDFDPGTGTFYLSCSTSICSRGYIQKLDANGNLQWAKLIDDSGTLLPNSISVDLSENIYLAGTFENSVSFGTLSGPVSFASNGWADICLLKLDSIGNIVFAKHIGGPNSDFGNSVLNDYSGNSYLIGRFDTGVTDIDPGNGVFSVNEPCPGTFITKFDNNGNFINAKYLDCYTILSNHAIFMNSDNSFYLTGHFDGIVDFDPGIDTFNITSIWGFDIFILKLSQCNTPLIKDTSVTSCNPYFFNNQFYTQSGVYYEFYSDTSECDSLLKLELDIQTDFSSLSEFTCNNYFFNDSLYSYSGIYYDTLTNSYGCDSIIELNLQVVLNDTIIPATSCFSFSFNNNTFYSSGNYSDTLTGSLGCDSIVNLILTINAPDTTIYQTGNILTANSAVASTYQWLDCEDGYSVIPGEIYQSFTATQNGNFSVIITQYGCTDTSACYNVSGVSVNSNDFGNQILLYPNPTDDIITIQFPFATDAKIEITDIRGKIIKSQSVRQNVLSNINIKELAGGMYFVKISITNNTLILKLIHE